MTASTATFKLKHLKFLCKVSSEDSEITETPIGVYNLYVYGYLKEQDNFIKLTELGKEKFAAALKAIQP